MKHRLLVIDDDPHMRKLIITVLSGIDCIIAEAADGFEGLIFYEHFGASLIIIDMQMPRMNGLETIAALRCRSTKTPIIIAISGNLECLRRAQTLGADHILLKPFQPKELVWIIERLID